MATTQAATAAAASATAAAHPAAASAVGLRRALLASAPLTSMRGCTVSSNTLRCPITRAPTHQLRGRHAQAVPGAPAAAGWARRPVVTAAAAAPAGVGVGVGVAAGTGAALSASGRLVVGRVNVEACAPVLEDGVLSDAAEWVLQHLRSCGQLNLLPPPLDAFLSGHELQTLFIIRESLLVVAVLVVILNADRICRTLNWVWGTLVMRDDEVTESEYQGSAFKALVSPLQLFSAAFLVTRHVRLLIPFVNLSLRPLLVRKLRMIALAIATTQFMLGWKDRAIACYQAVNPSQAPILRTLRRFLSLFIGLLGLLLLMESVGVGAKSVLAVGGVSGIAFGFASKEIISNFFGGIVLLASQPFVVGDSIKAGSVTGKVLDIGFLKTTVEGLDKSTINVPNSMFTTAVITNLSRAGGRVLEATFELRTQDVVRVRGITDLITQMLVAQPQVDLSQGPARAFLKELGPQSLQIGILATLKPMTKTDFLDVRQHILEVATAIIMAQGAFVGTSAPFEAPKPESLAADVSVSVSNLTSGYGST